MLGYCKLCELEDFRDEALDPYLRETSGEIPRGREHRKQWEIAQAARALTELGATGPQAELLGVAAGIEPTLFWLTRHARRVFASDLYFDAGQWQGEAERLMLATPGRPGWDASRDWNPRRLVVQHMDATELRYEDDSFDGVFCTSSIEHFGDGLQTALTEMHRVLKPGAIVSLSTEYRLAGPGPGVPGLLIFDERALLEQVVSACDWALVEPLDLTISESTLATESSLEEAVADARAGREARLPHIVLRVEDYLFTSVHIALRKAA